MRSLAVDAKFDVIVKKIKKGLSSITGLLITLIRNEIKGMIQTIKSLQDGGVLLKGTNRKITGQFLNFLRPLMKAGLPLMKNVLPPLAERVLV